MNSIQNITVRQVSKALFAMLMVVLVAGVVTAHTAYAQDDGGDGGDYYTADTGGYGYSDASAGATYTSSGSDYYTPASDYYTPTDSTDYYTPTDSTDYYTPTDSTDYYTPVDDTGYTSGGVSGYTSGISSPVPYSPSPYVYSQPYNYQAPPASVYSPTVDNGNTSVYSPTSTYTYSPTTNNSCTTDSCNTTTTITNPAPVINNNNVIDNPPSQVVYTTPTPVYNPPTCYTCSCNSIYCPQPIAYNNPTPYVTLTQVPYTGLDLGPFGEVIYWSLLVLACLIGAYLIAVKRVQNTAARWLKTFLFGSNDNQTVAVSVSKTVQPSYSKPSVHQTVVTPANSGVDDFILSQIHRNARTA